jgi:hypothetical protein
MKHTVALQSVWGPSIATVFFEFFYYYMGGGINAADTSPTSLIVHFWIELFAEHNGLPTARDDFYCPTSA